MNKINKYLTSMINQMDKARNIIDKVIPSFKEDAGKEYLFSLLNLLTCFEKCKEHLVGITNQYLDNIQQAPKEENGVFMNEVMAPKMEVSANQVGYYIKIYDWPPLRNRITAARDTSKWGQHMIIALDKLKKDTGDFRMFERVLVVINICHPLKKTGDIFDLDNVCIHPIINNIKGSFCKDDSRNFLEFFVRNTVDEIPSIEIKVLNYEAIKDFIIL